MSLPLSPEAIQRGLPTRFIGRRVLYFPSTSSTMDEARSAARTGASEGTVIIADEQQAGRGRMGRSWVAPPGSSILCSVIFRPTADALPLLPMIASLAVARTLEALAPFDVRIKWPNDVLVNGKKVCGILIEGEFADDQPEWAILGVGLNVNLDPRPIPTGATPPTSLSHELSHEVPRLGILRRLLIELESLYLAAPRDMWVYREWRERLETLGREIRVALPRGEEVGVAEDVDPEGALYLRRKDGARVRLIAGEVFSLVR